MDTPLVEERPTLAARVAASPGDLLEQIAREYGVSTLEVVRHLPAEQGTTRPRGRLRRHHAGDHHVG